MTIAVFQQIRLGQYRPLGFNKEHLLRVANVSDIEQSVVRNELGKNVLVKELAFSNYPLLEVGSWSNGFQWQGKSADTNPIIYRSNISENFIETIGLRVINGRSFYEGSETDIYSVIINKTLADLMGDEGKINGELWQGNRSNKYSSVYNIVGIVDDYIFDDLYRVKGEPLMLHKAMWPLHYLYVRFYPQSDVGGALKTVQSTLSQFQTSRPLEYIFVDDLVNRMFDGQRREGYMVALFSILSVLISCLGLFGLVTYIAESKTKEIGIRKVFGANVGNIVVMLTKEFLILVTLSALIATPPAYYWIERMLQGYSFRISIGWEIFAATLIVTALFTLITVGWKAYRAATANPVKSIKTE